jgi:predicted ATPase/class 3 adenylate cyclase
MQTTAPTGTVAFLFTDVEASTRRWERYGEAMREALRRHDAVVRSEIEAHDGYIFKTIGDAFCAAFPTAGAALVAAIGVQRRLGREDFRAVDGLYVRMAIHAGETDERDGDYFGTAVNRTARLLTAGHGGQILLSGLAADLALPALPAGVTLRHLGELPLRDLKEPERVYQPVAGELRSEFKPLRALETPPNNLPRQATSFVGRHDDVARVEALLDAGPLLTITGAGGIGKTRLALEVAASRVNDERDGAWLVDLSSIVSAGLIPATILSTLGGELSPGSEPLDDLLRYLQKREMLLVLDNSEHLVSEVASVVGQVLARCPLVTILATSRQSLDISGERLYRLSTLDVSSAVRLFDERARAVDPDFRIDEKLELVQSICARLDGIALAIELAAARVRTMSVESVAEHLELRLLSGGRDRRPRQQTMRALIDWSYDLLAPAERRALRRCSAFMRGFTLRAATEVCGGDVWQVLDELTSLADKSLIVAETGERHERYRLLEPIREYAFQKLGETEELPDVLQLHAHALASLARAGYEEWEHGPGADWLTRLEKDLPNFRVALRWSVEEGNDLLLGAQIVASTTPLFLRLSLLTEGIEYCRRLLECKLELQPRLEGRLRYGLSTLYSNIGENKKCLEEALRAAALYRDAGDARGLARALSQVASRCAMQSQYDDAKAAAEEALQLARESGDRRLLADVLRRCAEAFGGDGDEAVRAHYEESVTLFRSLGRDDETARALGWWGHWEQAGPKNYRASAERLLEAAELDERSSMFWISDVASSYLALGDPVRAEPFARKSLMLAAGSHHEVLIALATAFLAAAAIERDGRNAALLLGFAQKRLREAGWELLAPDSTTIESLYNSLDTQLGNGEFRRLLAEGAAWTPEDAMSRALSS